MNFFIKSNNNTFPVFHSIQIFYIKYFFIGFLHKYINSSVKIILYKIVYKFVSLSMYVIVKENLFL